MPSAASWSAPFHAMRLPYMRAPGSASSTSSGASAASTSNIRLFVAAARSMSAGSSVDLRMYVFEPCEMATHIFIRPTDLHITKRVTHTFLFKTSDSLTFARVLAILSSRFVLVLVLVRSGTARSVMRSSACRQLDELHPEGVA